MYLIPFLSLLSYFSSPKKLKPILLSNFFDCLDSVCSNKELASPSLSKLENPSKASKSLSAYFDFSTLRWGCPGKIPLIKSNRFFFELDSINLSLYSKSLSSLLIDLFLLPRSTSDYLVTIWNLRKLSRSLESTWQSKSSFWSQYRLIFTRSWFHGSFFTRYSFAFLSSFPAFCKVSWMNIGTTKVLENALSEDWESKLSVNDYLK